MPFLHETHRVVGAREGDFEAAYREGWMPTLAAGDDARLLWFLHQAHGSGASYQVTTITAVADGGAWERLALRVQRGDLRSWARDLDETRHDVRGRILSALPFSPLDTALADVPVDGRRHDPSLYMEDTMWPKRGQVEEYVRAAGDVYARTLGAGRATPLIRIVAALQTVPGAGRHPEVTLVQRVESIDGLVGLLTSDLPDEMTRPGTWMHDALQYRDQWRSKLLRSATWSPLP